MRYQSNLTAPDLTPLFADILLDPPKQIMGHDAPSHKDFEPGCTFWTHDEAAILYNIALEIEQQRSDTAWVDIGARFGWTGRHIQAAQTRASALWLVDPILGIPGVREVVKAILPEAGLIAKTAGEFFRNRKKTPLRFTGFVIDGNHDEPEPLLDAEGALACAEPDCVVIFHDFFGKPIRDGVRYLMQNGFKCRVYWTPNGVACCWRGFEGWTPPDHQRDPAIEWIGHQHTIKQDFPLGECV